jgi:hypothetical protein
MRPAAGISRGEIYSPTFRPVRAEDKGPPRDSVAALNRTPMLPPVSWISAAMTSPRTGFKKRTRDPSLSSLCLLLFPPPPRKNYAAARGGKIPPPPRWNSLPCRATGEEPSSSSSQYLHAVVGVRQRSGNLSVPSG